jgi:hypothetical protein
MTAITDKIKQRKKQVKQALIEANFPPWSKAKEKTQGESRNRNFTERAEEGQKQWKVTTDRSC